jgi:hypothetical protein
MKWIHTLINPQCQQVLEGWKTGSSILQTAKKRNRNVRLLMMRKRTIESKLIQVIQWKDKKKKERDQYDLKQPIFIVSC